MVALIEGAFLASSFVLLVLAAYAFIATVAFLGCGFLDARQEHQSRTKLPSPSPGPS